MTKLIVILILMFTCAVVKAQGIPQPVQTTFIVDCFTADQDTVTFYWGYQSDGQRKYIGSGFNFETESGLHPNIFIVTVPVGEIPPVLGLAKWYTNGAPGMGLADMDTGEVRYISTDVTYVEFSQPLVRECDAPITPADEPCPSIAINSATGLPYCYIPDHTGVVPLPPAPKGS